MHLGRVRCSAYHTMSKRFSRVPGTSGTICTAPCAPFAVRAPRLKGGASKAPPLSTVPRPPMPPSGPAALPPGLRGSLLLSHVRALDLSDNPIGVKGAKVGRQGGAE